MGRCAGRSQSALGSFPGRGHDQETGGGNPRTSQHNSISLLLGVSADRIIGRNEERFALAVGLFPQSIAFGSSLVKGTGDSSAIGSKRVLRAKRAGVIRGSNAAYCAYAGAQSGRDGAFPGSRVAWRRERARALAAPSSARDRDSRTWPNPGPTTGSFRRFQPASVFFRSTFVCFGSGDSGRCSSGAGIVAFPFPTGGKCACHRAVP